MHRKESRLASALVLLAKRIETRHDRESSNPFALLLQLSLYLIGFGALCKSAFTVSSALGWLAIALSCFIFESLAKPNATTDRNSA